MVSWDPKRLKALDDLPVEVSLRVRGTSGEGVDAHQSEPIRVSRAGGGPQTCAAGEPEDGHGDPQAGSGRLFAALREPRRSAPPPPPPNTPGASRSERG